MLISKGLTRWTEDSSSMNLLMGKWNCWCYYLSFTFNIAFKYFYCPLEKQELDIQVKDNFMGLLVTHDALLEILRCTCTPYP